MAESDDETHPTVNRAAARLASELGRYNETPGIPDNLSEILTPLQNALVSDAFGLLNGIAFGTITMSQPRIQANLIRVIAELSESQHSTDAKIAFAEALSSILSRAGTAGLTADNIPLISRVKPRSR